MKNSFAFAVEIVEHDSEFLMRSLDVDSLFTNIPLEETIDVWTNTLFQNTERLVSLLKLNLRNFYPLLQKNPSLLLMDCSSSKLMKSLWVHL